mgnify:FL=1
MHLILCIFVGFCPSANRDKITSLLLILSFCTNSGKQFADVHNDIMINKWGLHSAGTEDMT